VCLCVCLSVTTITKTIVDGFVPNFMGRFVLVGYNSNNNTPIYNTLVTWILIICKEIVTKYSLFVKRWMHCTVGGGG